MPEVEISSQDIDLVIEARKYGIEYRVWRDMTPRERRHVKMSWAKARRGEARRAGLGEEAFLLLDDSERAAALKAAEERGGSEEGLSARGGSEELAPRVGSEERLAGGAEDHARARVESEDSDSEGSDSEDEADSGDEARVRGYHSQADRVPPPQARPIDRALPTVGAIRTLDTEDVQQNPILRGAKKQLLTLADCYSHYTIGDGEHYIQVDRLEPKKWQGIAVAGYLGKITAAMTMEQFMAKYGGREYHLTVYGPSPRGKIDENGRPVIVAKTDQIKITVPRDIPILIPVPTNGHDKRGFDMYPHPGWNPFAGVYPQMMPGMPMMPGMGVPGMMPTTPADAQMFSAMLGFHKSREEQQANVAKTAATEGAAVTQTVVETVSATAKQAMDQTRQDAAARELRLEKANERLQEELLTLRKKIEEGSGKNNNDAVNQELVKAVTQTRRGETDAEMLASVRTHHQEELLRVNALHTESLNRVRHDHEEDMKRVDSTHKQEIARQDARFKDLEDHQRRHLTDVEARHTALVAQLQSQFAASEKQYKDRIEQLEKDYKSRSEEREKFYQAELGRIRTEEKTRCDDAVKKAEEHGKTRIEDLVRMHDRDMTMLKEQYAQRVENAQQTLQMKVDNLVDRLSEAQKAVEDAKEEVAKGKDLPTLLAEGKEMAAALGFEEKGEGGGNWAERLATSVGAGLGQSIGNIGEWLPEMMRNRAAAQGPPRGQVGGGPRGQMPQQAQAAQQQRRRRAPSSWATEGSPPMSPPPGGFPEATVAGGGPQDPTVVQAPPVPAATQPVAQAQQQQAAEPPPPEPQGVPIQQMFDEASARNFRSSCEQAIDGGMPPEIFASAFYGQYPEQSVALVTNFAVEQAFEVVRQMSDGAESALLRPDGKRWVQTMWNALRRAAGAPAA